jgi:dihydropteroate synthase
MMRPWELPHCGTPHQAIPLGDGWWRAPAPRVGQASFLQRASEAGLNEAILLPDESIALRPDARFVRRALADRDTLTGAAFPSSQDDLGFAIARIEAGIRVFNQPPATPNWMAILNLTPDSFSDGGQLDTETALLAQAMLAKEQGAAWLDLGAESTRPGAHAISSDRQLARLLPAIEALLPLGVPLSIDTRSSVVAAACLRAGASMINDVSGLSDPEMAACCAEHQAALTLMHMRGTPADMQQHCSYRFLLGEVADELAASAAKALAAGVEAKHLLLDPGIGFAKTVDQSRQLLAQLGALRALGYGLLVGPSRKSFQADLLPERSAAERDCGTAGAASSCVLQGVTTLRLHSGEYWDAARVAAGIAATPRPSLLKGSTGFVDLD